jgi:hypothetical protein
MRPVALLGIIALLAGGCAMIGTRPVYQTLTSTSEGHRVLVVGLERDLFNRAPADSLARELAWALAQRGRPAIELAAFADTLEARDRPLPLPLVEKLGRGVVDPEAAERLRQDGVRLVIFLEVQVYEQVWSLNGKRSRVGLAAHGRDLADGAPVWRAYTTPEVDDDPGRGFQLATEAAVDALARVISGEPVRPAVPSVLAPALRMMR